MSIDGARRAPRGGGAAAVGVLLLVASVALGTGPVAALSCAPQYSVRYASPVWIVTWRAFTPISIDETWYRDPWNSSLVPFAPHVDRTATAGERIVLRDADANGNLTAGDRIEVFDDPPSLAQLTFGWGPNETALAYVPLTLADGYQTECRPPPVPWYEILAPFLAVAIVVASLAIVLWLGRRKRRTT